MKIHIPGFLFALVFAFLLLPRISWAAPSISGVSGTIPNGQQITISGSGFGVNGPTVVIFDSFDNGINGNPLALNLAEVGAWTGKAVGYDQQAIYANNLKVSGSLSAKFDFDRQGSGQNPAIYIEGLPVFNSFYTSYWAVIPSGENWPGEGGIGKNWKLAWVGWPDPDVWSPAYDGNNCWHIGGNSWPYPECWSTHAPTKGLWARLQVWVKGREDTTGEVKLWVTDSNDATTYESWLNRATLLSGDSDKRSTFYLNGYGRDDPNSHAYFDDVYFAAGEYAQARVEIGNNVTYSSCTNLAIMTPTSWSDSQITATVRQGRFANGSQAYLYVFDANGNISNGYPITISGGTPSQCNNSICEFGETCTNCPQDCLSVGQVCCSGTAYAGNCCSEYDCSSTQDCISNQCTATCTSQGYQCCSSCQSGQHPEFNSDCPEQVCCAQCQAPSCLVSSASWQNTQFARQNSSFTAQFDATPLQANMDGLVALSTIQGASYSDYAILVRFNTTGFIDERNGSAYFSDYPLVYSLGTSYHFRLEADISTRRYSVYATPQGGSEVRIAHNYSFRTEQSTATELNYWGLIAETGSLRVCDITIGTCRKADTDCDNCVEMFELNSFIDRWKINNLDVTIRELIEAIGLWKRGC